MRQPCKLRNRAKATDRLIWICDDSLFNVSSDAGVDEHPTYANIKGSPFLCTTGTTEVGSSNMQARQWLSAQQAAMQSIQSTQIEQQAAMHSIQATQIEQQAAMQSIQATSAEQQAAIQVTSAEQQATMRALLELIVSKLPPK